MDVNEEHLREIFSNFGRVTDVSMMKSKMGRKMGVAWVTMATHKEAEEALAKMDQGQINGQAVTLEWKREKARGGGGAGARRFSPPRRGFRGRRSPSPRRRRSPSPYRRRSPPRRRW